MNTRIFLFRKQGVERGEMESVAKFSWNNAHETARPLRAHFAALPLFLKGIDRIARMLYAGLSQRQGFSEEGCTLPRFQYSALIQ